MTNMEHEQEIDDLPVEPAEIEAGDAGLEQNPEREAAEQEARKYGWRPKDEFDRDPAGWVDADRFLDLPSTAVKMLRDENREIQRRHKEELDAKAAENRQMIQDALRIQAEEKRAQYEARIAEMTRAQREAVEIGDVETYDKIAAQKQSMKPPELPGASPKADLTVQQYREANEWTKDPILWDFACRAVDATPEIQQMPADKQLEFAEQRVKDLFPHKFQSPTPPAAKASRVDGGGLGGAPARGGANSLPSEARAAGREFVEMGVFRSIDDYAKAYFAGET